MALWVERGVGKTLCRGLMSHERSPLLERRVSTVITLPTTAPRHRP